jgi:hypothetical protein
MTDTYQRHIDAALQLLRDAERLPRRKIGLQRVLVASARVHATLAQAAAAREAGDAIVGALDELRTSRRG